ncbi:outer envelope pore protein 16-4, chloroplastic-like [Vicia villosa]|uniref:outer envelope pore protein 16-4, chloroplastic-like n=1 Tax=Vicia villosa TaxID=3911 RepID=UPI00273B30D7|nr:outer envelope pore protein 16-4, chloroplastic-like [Vicia villosa]
MEEDLDDVVPCTSLAVESILRVGTAGAIWGLCTGPYDARTQGLKGIARAYFVANSVRVFGTQCGLVAGVFSITHCGVKKYRRRNDWVEYKCFQSYCFESTISIVIMGNGHYCSMNTMQHHCSFPWETIMGLSCIFLRGNLDSCFLTRFILPAMHCMW